MKPKRFPWGLNYRQTKLPHCSAYRYGHCRDELLYPFVHAMVSQLVERIRVIYLTRNEAQELVLLTVYAESRTDNLSGAVLKEIRRALEP